MKRRCFIRHLNLLQHISSSFDFGYGHWGYCPLFTLSTIIFSSFFFGGGAVGEVFEIILEMFLEGVNFSCVQFFWG